MRAPLVALGAVLLAALFVAGCGSGATITDTSPAAATQTVALPTPGRSTTVPTNIVVSTDSSSYKTTDTIRISATNNSNGAIFAANGKAGCSVFDMEMKTAEGWKVATIQPCAAAATDSTVVVIAKDKPYTASIQPQATGKSMTIPAGTYRIALSYSTFSVPPPMMPGSGMSASLGQTRVGRASSPLTTVYSEAFVVR